MANGLGTAIMACSGHEPVHAHQEFKRHSKSSEKTTRSLTIFVAMVSRCVSSTSQCSMVIRFQSELSCSDMALQHFAPLDMAGACRCKSDGRDW